MEESQLRMSPITSNARHWKHVDPKFSFAKWKKKELKRRKCNVSVGKCHYHRQYGHGMPINLPKIYKKQTRSFRGFCKFAHLLLTEFPQGVQNVIKKKQVYRNNVFTEDGGVEKPLSPKPSSLRKYVEKYLSKAQVENKYIQDSNTVNLCAEKLSTLAEGANIVDKEVFLRTLVEQQRETPEVSAVTVTLSDNYGDDNTTIPVQYFLRVQEVLTDVLNRLRYPHQLLPQRYYQMFQVYSPDCIRPMPMNEKIYQDQVTGVQNYTYLVRRLTSHYKGEEDEKLVYCKELLGVDKNLRVWRYMEVKMGRARLLRAKIMARAEIIRLMEAVEEPRLIVRDKTTIELLCQLVKMGFLSDPEREVFKCGEENELQKTPYITDQDFGGRNYHWCPDYGYLQRIFHFCHDKDITAVLQVLRGELQQLKIQYEVLLSTPPDILYAEDESVLLDCLRDEGVKAQKYQDTHEKFLKSLEEHHQRVSGEYFNLIQSRNAAWDQYENLIHKVHSYKFILESYAEKCAKMKATLKWHKLQKYKELIETTRNECIACETKL
ncbi:hypothetical protein Hamer_G012570, partial [Homarus americanus]